MAMFKLNSSVFIPLLLDCFLSFNYILFILLPLPLFTIIFRYLHEILRKNEQVTENNRKLLVECLRAIAEILIWGDQNESSVFE